MRMLPALALLWITACSDLPPAQQAGRVEHVVLVWLREPGNAAQRAELVRAAYGLTSIPGIVHAFSGPPLQSMRPEVDDSFDVALTFVFRDAAALEAYLTDPRHLQAVTDVLAPRAARFLVYDFVESPPAD